MKCELESKELLTFCIKKLKGLNKVKLVDAGFIWTEPHSKRLKVPYPCPALPLPLSLSPWRSREP